MGLLPHPFANVASDQRVILLDPLSDIADCCRCWAKHDEGLDEMTKLMLEGHIVIGEKLDCNSPAGVDIVRTGWKNSK